MLKVGIKFCGGCNPGYDRGALADYVKTSLHGRVEFVSLDREGIDMILAVEGCKTCCADLSAFEDKPIHFISQIEDAGKFLQKILIRH
ncbi:MAG: hypothetical protein JRF72_05530 [Deltaproteobacteria bacterium]|jgi:hypothetical protein|nr:hypothetical protein [Deltaproteobacteria bacterium]